MTTCPQCLAAQRDLALAHMNHTKETPMTTTTPERLTWTPDDGADALLAIRDRVKAAQDSEPEPLTAWVGGAVITDLPCIDEDDLMLAVTGQYVTVYGEPLPNLTRVEWTPPTELDPDPEPSWADADVVIAAGDYPDGAFNLRQRRGSGWSTPFWATTFDTQQVAEAYRLDGTTPVALIRTVDGKPRVCAEAILALGVDSQDALDAWVHNLVGRSVWDWLRDPGGDNQ